jgi:hypothetical protein
LNVAFFRDRWARQTGGDMKRMILSAALALMAGAAVAQEAPAPFAVGQVWTLKGAPDGSRFTVMQIDIIAGETVVHGSPSGFPPVVLKDSVVLVSGGHMPFSEDAVRRSVDGLERSDASVTATFRSGYDQWKSANGGVFTITIPEAVAYAKDTFLAGQRVDQ